MNRESTIQFAFFGSSRLSVIVLDELERAGYIPSLIITTPDKPKGRKLIITPNVVKEWAMRKNIPVLTPVKLDDNFIERLNKGIGYGVQGEVRTQSAKTESNQSYTLHPTPYALFVVASYGKIIPGSILDLPKYKTLNIHPSLLPKYRGPSPLPSAMLDDEKNTGVTIMKLDNEMDHGPIVAQEKVTIEEWHIYEDFEEMMAVKGAQLLAGIIPDWITGKIKEKEQDHSLATYTRKMTKEDGLIDITDSSPENSYKNFLKIQAYHQWPQAYFFIDQNGAQKRVKVTQASFKDGVLAIEKVIPEGKKEMSYEEFKRGS